MIFCVGGGGGGERQGKRRNLKEFYAVQKVLTVFSFTTMLAEWWRRCSTWNAFSPGGEFNLTFHGRFYCSSGM